LQKVNTAKDKMFSIIGHDLRGPVGTIKSFLDLLIENPELTNTENTLNILKTMQQSLGSAYTLLDNLLLWARNQRGQIEYKPEFFEINEPIDESINLVRENIKIKNIKISTRLDYKGKVFADQVMITTVLRNLISNSIKFTPVNGEIQVIAKKHIQKFSNGYDENIEIQVIDNGVGIKTEEIEKILKSEEMYTTKGTELEQGSGLGINICIDFLMRHNKQLFIENNNGSDGRPIVGTTFKFYLDKA
jgi:signal transduction histidine kinase